MQKCVMSLWLLKLYMDWVMRGLEVGLVGKGVRLIKYGGMDGVFFIVSWQFDFAANLKK